MNFYIGSTGIAARFDDSEFQKYHIDDMTMNALILTIFGN